MTDQLCEGCASRDKVIESLRSSIHMLQCALSSAQSSPQLCPVTRTLMGNVYGCIVLGWTHGGDEHSFLRLLGPAPAEVPSREAFEIELATQLHQTKLERSEAIARAQALETMSPADFERFAIERALLVHRTCRKAAKALGIGTATLYRRIQRGEFTIPPRVLKGAP